MPTPTPTHPTPAKPMLLAPAGDWDCARAAVENGADILYFGLDRFNARMRAQNFTVSELPELMAWLHERGVRGYVTFNTLTFTNELPEAEDYLRHIIAAGADAAIVQDVGLCRLIRKLSPDFPINASTQMTITSAHGIQFAERLGANMVALGRECSLDEIEQLQCERVQSSSDLHPRQFPLEVFIHGALCLSCSGQCLASESLGGRSANRGECAQPCRLAYRLIQDGVQLPLGTRRFLLSPKDLAGLEQIPQLICSGVTCLKIEGRLKSPEYVATICNVYRQAIDTAWDLLCKNEFKATSCRTEMEQIMREARYELEMVFSRGLGTGWFLGTNHQQLCHARFSNNRGLLLGKVQRVVPHSYITIQTPYGVNPGDGVAFVSQATEEILQGGNVYGSREHGEYVDLEFSHSNFDMGRIEVGNWVYKTNDPKLESFIKQSYTTDKIVYRRPIKMTAEGSVGIPLTITVQDEQGHTLCKSSAMPLQEAHAHPLNARKLQEQLGRLGNTPFHLQELTFKLEGNCMIAVSELNHLRRSLIEELIQIRRAPIAWKLSGPLARAANSHTLSHSNNPPRLIVLVRNMDQLKATLATQTSTLVYCDFDDLRHCKDAVALAHNSISPDVQIGIAPPRIFKPGELPELESILQANPDCILVRNYDHLEYFKSKPCHGDYTLNVTNPITAEFYLRQCGLHTLTLSYDLDLQQIAALLQQSNPEDFEFTLHQRIPMFHTAFCLFCAYLTREEHYPNCGKICEKHNLTLRDRTEADHIILPDAACRNTIFNARIQTACEHFETLRNLGIKNFRIEFTNEQPEEVTQTVQLYSDLLKGTISGQELWLALKKNPLTRGNLIPASEK